MAAGLSQQYKLAVTSFEAAIALDAENALHWHELGQLHLEREAYEKALQAFDGALALNPNDLVALSGTYQPLVALGHHQEAQVRGDRMLELAPKDVRTLARMANRRLQMGLVHGQEIPRSSGEQTIDSRGATRSPLRAGSFSLAGFLLLLPRKDKKRRRRVTHLCLGVPNKSWWLSTLCPHPF